MACGLFIILYIYDRSSYDKWWDDSDRIYRTYIDGDFLGQEINSPSSPSELAATMRLDFEEIESATRFHPIRQEIMFQYNDLRVYVADVAYADSAFFNVFSIPLISGEKNTVLKYSNSIVISQRIAQIFFGNEDPLGKTLNYDNRRDYVVTGVMGPMPGKSHFCYDIYMADNHVNNKWIENGFCTYWKVKPGYNPEDISTKVNNIAFAALEKPLSDMLAITPNEFLDQGNTYNYGYQSIEKVYLNSNLQYELRPNSNIQYLYYDPMTWFAVIRVEPSEFETTIQQLENTWSQVEPSHPFRFTHLDKDFAKVYIEEQRLSKLFMYFTILSICIACMGLFGLALYNSEMRTKEIGIRNVLGASSWQIWLLLTKEFGYLTLLSIIISWPLTYYAMNKWLDTFVYRVEIPWWIFLTASTIALFIALITVSAQTLRASISNPVHSLRYV